MCLSKNNNVVNKSSTKSSLISAKRVVSWEELNSKNTVDECWIGYRGKVYDVTRWLAKHPGGLRSIMSTAGKDATSVMISLHAPETLAKHMKRIRQVGILPKERLTAASSSTECTEQALVELKQQQMEDDFAQLHDFFDREGWPPMPIPFDLPGFIVMSCRNSWDSLTDITMPNQQHQQQLVVDLYREVLVFIIS